MKDMEEIDQMVSAMKIKIANMTPEEKAIKKDELGPRILHYIEVADNVDSIIKESDKEFKLATSFNKNDWIFLAFCLGLQIARQYWLTPFKERLDDQEAAKQTAGHEKETSNRIHRLYHPSIEEIVSNPVPFDAMMGSPKFNANLSGKTHRYIPGHDPILGYVVGTMNILTSTVTGFDGKSYHVKTGFDKLNRTKDCLFSNADNAKIIEYTKNRIFHEGKEGMTAFVTALYKEHIHLKSDIYTTEGLPLPFLSSVDPNLARTLSNYGLDMLNVVTVGKQTFWASFINLIIAVLHRLMMPDGSDERVYKAKTQKMITYANTLATVSNAVYSYLTKNWNKLDVGGSFVTIFQIIKTSNFITDLQIALRNANLEVQLNQ